MPAAVVRACDSTSLALVHAPAYIEEISAFARAGGGYLDDDTVCSPASFDVAALAAGAAVDAVVRVAGGRGLDRALSGSPAWAPCPVDRAMGFCLFNNVALGAMAAVKRHGLDRVLIVDFDVHHGNGTQAIFWEDPRVGFLSMHRFPFYPGTGAADERGEGGGLGDGQLADRVRHECGAKSWMSSPRGCKHLPIISARSLCWSAPVLTPIAPIRSASLGLEAEDFAAFTDRILEVAAAHAGGRVVSVLEGGYNPPALAECVEQHLTRLLTSSPTLL